MYSVFRSLVIAAGVAISGATSYAFAGELLIDFNNHPVEKSPAGMSCVLSGRGDPADWKIHKVEGGTVLAQLSEHDRNARYPVCVANDVLLADVDLSVRFEPISGDTDQAGGLVWRYQNRDNFYVVRANALEDNVVLYKMHKGRRSSLAPVGTDDYGADAQVPRKKWSTLSVSVAGDTFTVFLNGKQLYKVKDTTFTKAGRVGVWTKADSVTYFDDLRITEK